MTILLKLINPVSGLSTRVLYIQNLINNLNYYYNIMSLYKYKRRIDLRMKNFIFDIE